MSLDLPSGAGGGPTPVSFGATRTLSKNFGADERELALKIFSGTVLEQFYVNTVFYDRSGEFIAQKQLDGGHEAQWPVIGDDIDLFNATDLNDTSSPADGSFDEALSEGGLNAGYHTPGEFITGKKIKMSERVIRVDDILVAPIDVPFADLNLSHFDVLGPYAQKLARSLATDNDRKIASVALSAALDGAVSGVYPGGNSVTREVGSSTNPFATGAAYEDTSVGSGRFRDDVAELAKLMDEDNVPEQGRYLFIPPVIRKLLRHETDVFNRDFNEASLAGTMNSRAIGVLEGFQLITSNNLPGYWTTKTDGRYALIDSNFAKYDFNCSLSASGAGFARPAAIALCGASMGSAAVGMVQAQGIRTHIEDDERRNVKFMKAQMHVGYGVLAPWCAGAIMMQRTS